MPDERCDVGMIGSGALADLVRAIDLVGVFANAILGGALARRLGLDLIGFVGLALVSGLGGGMLRDVLLQHGPPAALVNSDYLVAVLAGAAVAYLLPVRRRIWQAVLVEVDAVALGCWSAVGAQKTLAAGFGWLAAVLLGCVTAVGGSAIRDIATGRVPLVFGGTTLYATCAVAGSAVMVVLDKAHASGVGLLLGTVVGAGLCIVARWRDWRLPQGHPETVE